MLLQQDPSVFRCFRGHKSVLSAVSFLPQKTSTTNNLISVATGSEDGSIILFENKGPKKGQLRAYKYSGHQGRINSLEFTPSGSLLASASQDNTVRFWVPNAKGDSSVLKAHQLGVRSVSFSRDGQFFLTSSDDKSIKIWSLEGLRFICTLGSHLNWVKSAKWSPDGRMIVSGSDDKTVRLWDVEKRVAVQTFTDNVSFVNGVGFHPDGIAIASCGGDGSIHMWDLRASRLIQRYTEHKQSASSICFHPNGSILLSTSADGTSRLWDLCSARLTHTLHAHNATSVNCSAFNVTGSHFVTGGSDRACVVWEMNEGVESEDLEWESGSGKRKERERGKEKEKGRKREKEQDGNMEKERDVFDVESEGKKRVGKMKERGSGKMFHASLDATVNDQIRRELIQSNANAKGQLNSEYSSPHVNVKGQMRAEMISSYSTARNQKRNELSSSFPHKHTQPQPQPQPQQTVFNFQTDSLTTKSQLTPQEEMISTLNTLVLKMDNITDRLEYTERRLSAIEKTLESLQNNNMTDNEIDICL